MERRWGSPDAATAAVRHAVRASLADLGPGDLVLAACSGGADSLALAAALAFEAPGAGLRAGAVVVDHDLQPGSARVAADAAGCLHALGLDPVDVVTVEVESTGDGLEAAARSARYAALEAAADRHGALTVLLGHTLDDQAEQVLLGLTRGSGARSLSGMPSARGRFRRPLLGVSREQCRASVAAQGLTWWDDPMNEDPAFTRVRARRAVADLERDLGPGVAAALARTASQLRDDADHLDGLADTAAGLAGPPALGGRGAGRHPPCGAHPRLAAAARRGRGAGRPGGNPAHRRVRPVAHRVARAGPGARPRRPAGGPIRWSGHHRPRRSG